MSQNWYLLAFGVELGPMPWEDLCSLAERGVLRGDARVRRGDEAWLPADSIAGLIQASPNTEDTSEFETTAAVCAPLAQAVETAPLPPCGPGHGERVFAQMPDSPVPSGWAPVTTAPAANISSKSDKRPVKKQKNVDRGFIRPQVQWRVSGAMLMGVACVLLLASAGYGGWKFLQSRSPRADHRQVATVYGQVYELIKRARADRRLPSLAGLQYQSGRRVAALCAQLRKSPDDRSASNLSEAGTYLSRMVSHCGARPGSPEESTFLDSERQFLSLLNAFNELEKK